MQTTALPDDPQALKALIGELERRDAALDARHATIAALELQIAVLRRARFDRRSEKHDQQLSHLELMLEELQSSHAEAVASRPPKRDIPPSPSAPAAG